MHLLQEMFTAKNRALYKSAKLYQINKIPEQEMIVFLQSRFAQFDVTISTETCKRIIDISENIPYHIQQLGHELWNICIDSKKISDADIAKAIKRILTNQNDFYLEIWRHLSKTQCALLEAVAKSGGSNIFSEEYKKSNNLSASSTVAKNIKILIEKTIVSEEQNIYYFQDPFFKMWILNFN